MDEKKSEHIDPWGSVAVNAFSYLFEEFGIKPIDERMLRLFNQSPHFRRGLIMGHRDMEQIVQDIEQHKQFILVSGFAASGEFHLGHKAIIDIYRFLRQYTDIGYFAVCDLDAYISRPDKVIPTLEKAREYAVDNIANAIALGVPSQDIYVQSQEPTEYFTLEQMISKQLNFNTMKAALGHTDTGKFTAAYLQISDILYPQVVHGPMHTLIPVGMDQEPLIRLARDAARKLSSQYGFLLPASVYTSHVPSLVGIEKKMSKSIPGSSIMLNSDVNAINLAVSGAFTGGRPTDEEQRRLGGNPEICPVYSFYKFHHPEDAFVTDVRTKCLGGKLMCGEDKEQMRSFLRGFSEEHMKKYKAAIPEAKRILQKSRSTC